MADLRSEFTWNTKQLFVHVTVDFATQTNPINKMIIWNTIIQLRENALLRIPELRASYPFTMTSQDASLRGNKFNVTVEWNVMPKVGRLYTHSRTFSGFSLPNEYIRLQKGKVRVIDNAASAA
jgi:signal peptidase complex subunit 3